MAIATVFFFWMAAAVKWADGIPTVQIVFFRAFVALVLSGVHLRWLGLSPLGTHHRLLLLRGLFGSLALLAFFGSLTHLPLATATVLQSLSPIFAAVLAVAFLGERLTLAHLALFALAGAGVLAIEGGGEGGSALGIAVAIAGAAFSACAYTVISRIGPREHPLVVILWFPLVTVPLVAPVLPLVWVWPSPRQWLALLLVGLFVQVAQYFMTRAWQLGPPGVVSLVSYLGVVWAGLGGWLLFAEPLTPRLALGTTAVLAAVLGAARLRRAPRRDPRS